MTPSRLSSPAPEQLDLLTAIEEAEQGFSDWDVFTPADEHECFYRGCMEIVAERYHCDRHEAILERQRAAQTRRNKEIAAERARARGAT